MAVYTFDLRGPIQGRTPEDYLKLNWDSDVPKADRFGVHSVSIYEFITPGATRAVVNGDVLLGLFEVPTSEVWEIFSIEQWMTAEAATGIYNNVRVAYRPATARWSVAGNDQWLVDAVNDAPLTRYAHFLGTDEWETHDEASETLPDAGLRKRILYPKTTLVARVEHGAGVTVDAWRVRIDAVRYPSTARLLAGLARGEIARDELFAALAHRFPSPAEAF